ncbi:MAG: hypothetical protein M1821_000630 [Bathelium mastoideum]|nr:MAG: hypothetical protein M1821_000630 [Bathelium mastoideum]
MAMRLIDTNSLRLKSFMDGKTPKYAILSHTWNHDEEISFLDMTSIHEDSHHSAAKKSGFIKILQTCQKAKANGIDFCWVDTCCIDNASSSELSEAINSMFRWYKKADVCYVLLSDLKTHSAVLDTALPKCRWFTRGWCLQELLAPRRVEFFDAYWENLGSKATLASLISTITCIDERVLADSDLVGSRPIAHRLSWAAKRETTREEDMAYCLLGILDINMPILYGEGTKAFVRLQEEIIKNSNDLSIFAFHNQPTHSMHDSPSASSNYCSLFATCPRDFLGCGDLVHTSNVHLNMAFVLTNKGLHFPRADLQIDYQRGLYSLSLNCHSPKAGPWTYAMHLQQVGPSLYVRCDERRLNTELGEPDSSIHGEDRLRTEREIYIIASITTSIQSLLESAEEYAIHVWSRYKHLSGALQVAQRSVTSNLWDESRMQFLTMGDPSFGGYWKVFPSRIQRLDGASDSRVAISDHFYLICGILNPGYGPVEAWVYLCSSNEWKDLEKTMGIMTNLNEALGIMSTNRNRSRITLSAGSTDDLEIAASIELRVEGQRRRFVLELHV